MQLQTYYIIRAMLVKLLIGLLVLFSITSILVFFGIGFEVFRVWKTHFKSEQWNIISIFDKQIINKVKAKSKLLPTILLVRKNIFILWIIMLIDGVVLIIIDMAFRN